MRVRSFSGQTYCRDRSFGMSMHPPAFGGKNGDTCHAAQRTLSLPVHHQGAGAAHGAVNRSDEMKASLSCRAARVSAVSPGSEEIGVLPRNLKDLSKVLATAPLLRRLPSTGVWSTMRMATGP